ncbi:MULTISPECIES: hypothetical protein [Frankia]|uniref:hypothetical protein n=1 Tax=Frankia TaxID=1854 RepID=UPI0012FF7B0B|nr:MULTISPECIES: hypothetical protein [Frankia]
MAVTALVRCNDIIRSVLTGASLPAASRTFAYPHREWSPRRWCVAFFVSGSTQPGELLGIGLVDPGRRVTDYERKIEVDEFRQINPPLRIEDIRESLRGPHAFLDDDGPLTENQSERLQEAVVEERPGLITVIAELFNLLAEKGPPGNAGEILEMERDAFGIALDIAGFKRRELLSSWRPPVDPQVSVPFLSGMSGWLIEDQLIQHDLMNFADSIQEPTLHYGWGMLRRPGPEGDHRLYVYSANRTPVEETLGVDFIYYHENHRCFVLVQYKRMEGGEDGGQWIYRPDNHIEKQLDRMAEVDKKCSEDVAADPRLLATPCLIKLCTPTPFSPRSGDLSPGFYLPQKDFKELLDDDSMKGPRGGRRLALKNIPRYLNNTIFTQLMADGWIGSRGTGTQIVADAIEESLRSGRSTIVAKRVTPG